MKYFKTQFFSGILILLLVNNLSAQWEPDVRLTYDDSTSWTSMNNAWCIAADGDSIHVVWYDNRFGNSAIYYKRSTDGGITWLLDSQLVDTSANSIYPSIAVSESNVHVVWFDDRDGNAEIYYKRSTDAGAIWGVDIKLSNSPDTSCLPSITVSLSNVHVAWHEACSGSLEIYYKHSTNGGVAWETEIRLTYDPADSYIPSIAVLDSCVHVVWHDQRDGNSEIYYKRSVDGGISWENDTRLTDDSASSTYPSIAAIGNNVHVVWEEWRNGDADIYYKRSLDEGTSWGLDTRLTDNPGWSERPSVTTSNSNVHVVWYDNRDENLEIYYKQSTDQGTTWRIDTRLTNDSLNSGRPSVAVSDIKVHVVWCDDRDGNAEIYYKRNPTGNAVQEETKNPKMENRNLKLTIYPNPFTTSTTITLPRVSEHQNTRVSVIELNIYDVSGRLVKLVPLSTNHLSLGIDLLPGIYFLKVDGKNVGKVVKVR